MNKTYKQTFTSITANSGTYNIPDSVGQIPYLFPYIAAVFFLSQSSSTLDPWYKMVLELIATSYLHKIRFGIYVFGISDIPYSKGRNTYLIIAELVP